MTQLPKATAQNDTMRRSLYVSAFLHFGFLLFLFFGLPSFIKPLPTPSMPVPYEIVDIADLTNTQVKKPEEAPKPPPPPPKPPEEKVTPPPEPPKPPEPQKLEEAKPPEQQAEATPLPKPAEKPKPKPPEVVKPKPDLLASVLKNVEQMKPKTPAVKTDDSKTPAKTPAVATPQTSASALSEHLTISEEDALRRQIEQCWNMPIGARDAKSLVVDIKINVNPDRTLQSAEVVDKGRMASDPFYRAAAEAALRAVYNPRCSPLAVPDGKYDQWKVIDFTFDPRDML